MNFFIGVSGRAGGAACDVLLQCVFLLLAHLQAIYIVAFLVLLLIVQSLSGIRRFLWESRTLLIPLGGVAIIVGLAVLASPPRYGEG